MKPTIQKIAIPGLTINARVWGPESGLPVLAMHGWLDNAATFDLLAPLLENCRIVSVDFPGHGFSDALPLCGNYHHIDRVMQMFQVADALGWDKFNILGHSMGGVIGMFMAATFPERIEKIAVIDATPYFKVFGSDIASVTRKYFLSSKKVMNPHTIYPNMEEAARTRVNINPMLPMKEASAMVLAEGGMIPVSTGYTWTFDLRLLLPNLMVLTEEAIPDIIKNISAPLCLIVGKEGLVIKMKQYREKLSIIEKLEVHELPGGHHLHLDEPKSVATVLSQFFTIATN